MNLQQIVFLLVSLIGGGLVMLSYYKGLRTKSGVDALWGGTPREIRKTYTASMLVSAIGYLITFLYLLVNIEYSSSFYTGPNSWFTVVNPLYLSTPHHLNNYFFHILFIFVLVPSAMWVPLVQKMVAKPSKRTWIMIRVSLGLVGLASLGILIGLLGIRTFSTDWGLVASIFGMTWFTIHTGILDAILWPSFWKRKSV